MYSNDFNEIRAGLVNYIGSALNSYQLATNSKSKHLVVAMLIEEAIALSKDADGEINIEDIKPLLKGCKLLADSRIKYLEKLGIDHKNSATQNYVKCSDALDNIIKSMEDR